MTKIALIAVGGAGGTVLRYICTGWVQNIWGGLFPLGTLLVNVAGCFGIGFFGMALTGPVLMREEYRLALLVGLFGGFTTYSTFCWETFSLINDGQGRQAAVNILLSNLVGLGAVWFGYRLAERLYGG